MSTIATRPVIDVEPFTLEFDRHTEHCTRSIQDALADVDSPTTAAILAEAGERASDGDHVREILTRRACDLADAGQHAQAQDLEEAAMHLSVCDHPCDCVTNAFDNWADCLEEVLGRIGSHHWAVWEPAAREPQPLPQHDIHGELTYFDLDRVVDVGDWARLKVCWNGEELTVEGSGHDGAAYVQLFPLTDQMREIADRWEHYAGYDDCRLGRLLLVDLDALLHTLDLWDVLDQRCDYFALDMNKVIAAFTALTAGQRARVDYRVLASLVDNDGWHGTPAELLRSVLTATA